MAYTKSLPRVANKLKKLIKERIKSLGLIDTGAMYDSIMVYPYEDTDGEIGFTVKAEDYFKYLDGDYNIIDYCVNSKEFKDYLRDSLIEDINTDIEDYLRIL